MRLALKTCPTEFYPIRSKTKPSRGRTLPAFRVSYIYLLCFEFQLVHWITYVLCKTKTKLITYQLPISNLS